MLRVSELHVCSHDGLPKPKSVEAFGGEARLEYQLVKLLSWVCQRRYTMAVLLPFCSKCFSKWSSTMDQCRAMLSCPLNEGPDCAPPPENKGLGSNSRATTSSVLSLSLDNFIQNHTPLFPLCCLLRYLPLTFEHVPKQTTISSPPFSPGLSVQRFSIKRLLQIWTSAIYLTFDHALTRSSPTRQLQ